ncbi:MAG: L-seryl-tRNA(Sec) selenium transferase [Acidobacteriota bacterium]|jgi:L-seryl-tRNA(Ser) seleniumtransferase
MASSTDVDPRRRVPSVDHVMQRPAIQALGDRHGRRVVLRHVRAALEELRRRANAGGEGLEEAVDSLPADVGTRVEAAMRPSLDTVLNASGVVVHTNLGRAPLSAAAAARVADVASSYSNLEYDLERGERGNREVHAESRLREMLGVESTVVVNNCAAAVLLAVNTLAEGREVLVSRGELVEIGGSFRIPEVLGKGGARLREVGTTNRTRITDFRAALTSETGLILKVHPSNFRIVGFTAAPSIEELAELAKEVGIPLMEDQGSGLMDPLPGALAPEATAPAALRGGAGVVTFSGDKLLGGPQAGLVAGQRALVEPMRRNPLYRALRVDKMTLAALDATLVEHEAGRAASTIPVLRMVHTPVDDIRTRAEGLASRLAEADTELQPSLDEAHSAVGGGAAPTVGVPTVLIALTHPTLSPDCIAAALRAGQPPVVVRVAENRLLVDLRTVRPDDEQVLLDALLAASRSQ